MANNKGVESGDSPYTMGEDLTEVLNSGGVFGTADKIFGKGTSVQDIDIVKSFAGVCCNVTGQKDEINAFDVNKTWDGIGKTKGNGQGIGTR